MKKATILLLRFGRIAGYIPFYYIPTTETFQLKKCSFQTVYFLGVLSFSTLWTLLYLYVFIHRLLNSSASVALAFTSWVIGSISMTLIFLSFWIYKHEITHQIRQLFTWWNQIQDCIYKRRSEKYAKIIISIWIITALIQMISMTILQLEHPGAVGFLSSHFAFGNTTIIPNWIHYTSVSLHLVMLVYYCFSALIGDVIPILFCLSYKVSFERLAELLVQNVSKVENQPETEETTDTDTDECIECKKNKGKKSQIRLEVEYIMRHHRTVQKCLQLFNDAFAPMIILFTCHMHCMCITCFYVCFVPHVSDIERYFYLSAGVSFLVRATVGFYYFGSISGSIKMYSSYIRLLLIFFRCFRWYQNCFHYQ